jgi:hypothetical protein
MHWCPRESAAYSQSGNTPAGFDFDVKLSPPVVEKTSNDSPLRRRLRADVEHALPSPILQQANPQLQPRAGGL